MEELGFALLVVLVFSTLASICLWLLRQRKANDTQGRTSPPSQQTQWLEELGAHAQDFLWVTSPKGRFLYVSSAFETIFERPVEDLYQDSSCWLDQCHPEDRDRIIKEFFEPHSPSYDVEYRLIRPDGSIRWLSGRTTHVIEAGKLRRMVGVVRDVTAAKLAQQALAEQTQFLLNAQRIANFGTWVVNAYPDSATRLSEETCRIFGFEPVETVPSVKVLREVIHLADKAKTLQTIDAAITTGEAYNVEYRITLPDNTIRSVREYGEVQSGEQGNTRVLGVVQDITRFKELEVQLLQGKKMEAIGTLAGGIAHDFNNILMAMSGNLEVAMAEIEAGAPGRENLLRIETAMLRASSLVNQILTFSRQEPNNQTSVDVSTTVEEALSLLRATLPAQVTLKTDIATPLPPVLANTTQIHQIVMNLVTNAYQAMPPEGGIIKVDLSEVRFDEPHRAVMSELSPGHYLRLAIRDNGSGIAAASINKIFDPFYSSKPRGEGTGLGLAVVHGIVESHSGTIDVTTTEQEGTCVEIFFPVTQEALREEVRRANSPLTLAQKNRILFLDDEPELVSVVERMLQTLGHKVASVTTPAEAIAKLEDQIERFDLLITDMNMPHISGLDVARRALQIRPGLKVILTSGNLNADLQEMAETAGIGITLAKPYKLRELDEAIRSA